MRQVFLTLMVPVASLLIYWASGFTFERNPGSGAWIFATLLFTFGMWCLSSED